ncbi:MAG: hypothetical protein ACX930_14175 [Erythrobacter sp.]
MRLSQYIERKPQVRRKKIKSAKASIATHGMFLPILSLWGAALLGLTVLVLPDASIARFGNLTDGALAGASARLAFAGIATLLGGGLAFVIGGAVRNAELKQDSNRPIASVVHARTTRPIDPASELGSTSLDAPLENESFLDERQNAGSEQDAATMPEPTLGELSQRGYEIEKLEDVAPGEKGVKGEIAFTHKEFQRALIESCEGATCEGATCEASPAALDEPDTVSPLVRKPKKMHSGAQTEAAAPRALDLAEFAELPGRNAVWVEGEAGAAEARAPIPETALQKLRRTPPDKLSLVEMIERFAGALHEHQQSERAHRPEGGSNRDAALVEALKALTLFTEQGFDTGDPAPTSSEQLGKTERELRDALVKLQTLRGAA